MDVLNITDKLILLTERLNESQRMANIGSWDWDILKDKVWWSDQTYRIFGIELDATKIRYETFFNMVHPDEQGIVNDHIKKAFVEKIPYSLDSRIILEDGTEKIVNIQGQVLFNNNLAYRMHGTAQDVTWRKEIENELKKHRDFLEETIIERTAELRESREYAFKTLEQLQKTQTQLIHSEKMSSIGQLAAGIAHELNNPINFINANAMSLGRDINDIIALLHMYRDHSEDNSVSIQEIKDFEREIDFEFVDKHIMQSAKDIQNGVSRAAEIIHSLKNLSFAEEAEFSTCSIDDGIIRAVSAATKNFDRELNIIVETQADIPPINCIPGQIEKALTNLITNAIEAIDENGIIKIHAHKGKQWIYIEISDDGNGIDHAQLNRVFEPFFTTKEVGKGTGLGLSISHGIIEKHGGKITVNSEPGKGTKFTVILPL